MSFAEVNPASFRDRTAKVVHSGGKVFRLLDEEALGNWQALNASRFFGGFVERGRLIRTREAEPPQDLDAHGGELDVAGVLQHDLVDFVSYPYEWPFGMLRDAAALQLDLLLAALDEGMTLKDGTPYNVQWRGSEPVFIDVPSIVRSEAGRPWAGYRQFCELFLFPLMLQAYRGIDFQPWLRGSLEGIPVAQMRRMFGWRDCLKRGVISHVILQNWVSGRYAGGDADTRARVKNAGFNEELVRANARRLRRTVEAFQWKAPSTAWSQYESDCHYQSADRAEKRRFVEEASKRTGWCLAWDLGSNTGEYSRLISPHGEHVIAMDGDHAAVEALYQSLRAEGPGNVTPLVMDLADPSPGLGWRGLERGALDQRRRPDLVLCLALIHHVVIGEHIPLPSFIRWLGELGATLVIEFVDRGDPMVKRLLAAKDDRYRDYNRDVFESAVNEHFRVLERRDLPGGTRTLFLAAPLHEGGVR